MPLGSGDILKVLKEHASGNFESRLDPKGLKGDDRELATWLNDYADKQRAADQVLHKTLAQTCTNPFPLDRAAPSPRTVFECLLT